MSMFVLPPGGRRALDTVRVIGIGCPERGDDGVGRAVARALRDTAPEGVWVGECAGEFSSLLDLWEGADAVIIVDALQGGLRPGTVLRLDALTEALPVPPASSTHGFGLADAVAIGGVLHRLPRTLVVYGVEAASFAHGAPLSGPVAAALPGLLAAVRREAGLLAHSESHGPLVAHSAA